MVFREMIREMKRLVLVLLVLTTTSSAFAQNTPPPPGTPGEQKSNALSGPRKQLATIVFAGLGGAILGLSTLSFYGRPQDNLRNIAIGFAVGIIAGTALVTFKAATNPQELYGEPATANSLHLVAASSEPVVRADLESPLGASWVFNF